jgi:hypothetical protein
MTAPCPDIAIYHIKIGPSNTPSYLAKYMNGGTLLPPTFEGRTEAEAVEAAREFWATEQAAVAGARAARGNAE